MTRAREDSSKTPPVLLRVRPLPEDDGVSGAPTLVDELGNADAPALKDRPSLTVLTGDRAGTLIHLDGVDVVVGRSSDAGVHLADASLSRRHARFFRVQHQVYVQDLGSTNGTFVRGKKIEAPTALEDGDQVQLGPNRVLKFSLNNRAEEEAAVLLYESSVRDPTTGAYNRQHFDDRLKTEKAFAEHHGTSLVLLLIDIDRFKQVNDTHGHLVGDAVLRVVAASVQRLLRPDDALVRYGGDEFIVLCRDTSLRNGLILAERLRAHVERLPFSVSGNDFHVTISVGAAGGPHTQSNWGTLVEAADRSMYRAKQQGRNRVAG